MPSPLACATATVLPGYRHDPGRDLSGLPSPGCPPGLRAGTFHRAQKRARQAPGGVRSSKLLHCFPCIVESLAEFGFDISLDAWRRNRVPVAQCTQSFRALNRRYDSVQQINVNCLAALGLTAACSLCFGSWLVESKAHAFAVGV